MGGMDTEQTNLLLEEHAVAWDEKNLVYRMYDTLGEEVPAKPSSIPPGYTLERGKYVVQEMMKGRTLASICGDKGMVSYATVWYWRRKHPDFDEACIYARKARAEWCHDQVLQMAEEAKQMPEKDHGRADAIAAYKWGAEKNDKNTYGGGANESAQGPATVIINTGIQRPETDKPTTTIEVKESADGADNV